MELLLWLFLLTSESIEAREEAAWRLREMGAMAWPVLEKALDSRDSELAGRARDILSAQPLPPQMIWSRPHLIRIYLRLQDSRRSEPPSLILVFDEPFDVPDEEGEERCGRSPVPIQVAEVPADRLGELRKIRVRPVRE